MRETERQSREWYKNTPVRIVYRDTCSITPVIVKP
jgi:hypothetical protein